RSRCGPLCRRRGGACAGHAGHAPGSPRPPNAPRRYDRPMLTETQVYDALRQVRDPELGRDIVTLEMVKQVTIEPDRIALSIDLTTPACPLKDDIERDVRSVLAGVGAPSDIAITWGAQVRRNVAGGGAQLVPGVKNIVAVASGKG